MEKWQAICDLLADKWVVVDRGGLYWGPHSGGYTNSIWQAGLYTETEAKNIERGCRGRGEVAKRADEQFALYADIFLREGTLGAQVAGLLSRS